MDKNTLDFVSGPIVDEIFVGIFVGFLRRDIVDDENLGFH